MARHTMISRSEANKSLAEQAGGERSQRNLWVPKTQSPSLTCHFAGNQWLGPLSI
jgi:hypothetical protein